MSRMVVLSKPFWPKSERAASSSACLLAAASRDRVCPDRGGEPWSVGRVVILLAPLALRRKVHEPTRGWCLPAPPPPPSSARPRSLLATNARLTPQTADS